MKTKKISILLTILCWLFVSACQKEIADVGDSTWSQQTALDSNYLSKIIYLDTTATTADTSEIISFYYDNLRRVIKMTKADNTSNNLYLTIDYSYNSTDTLPFKSVEYNPNPDTTTSYHFYDSQLRKLKDSSITGSTITSEIRVSRFSYFPGGFVLEYFYGPLASTLPLINEYIDSATLDAVGNITSYKEYHGPFPFVLEESVSLLYDDKPNPLAKLSNFSARSLLVGGEPFFIENFPQKNNVTQYLYSLTTFGSNVVDHRIDYTYKPNGFIKEGIEYSVPPSNVGGKILYVYTTL